MTPAPKNIRDMVMTGRRVTLVWQRRRFVCDDCGARHLEEHPEFEGNLTRRLARQIVVDTRVMTISAVAKREGLGWHKVMGLVTAWSNRVAQHRRRRRCRVLLVDETSIQRGHKYVTVIKNGDTGKVLDIVEHRSAAAPSRVSAFPAPILAASGQSSGNRRIPPLQESNQRLAAPRPPRPGPVPCCPLVRRRPQRRAPRGSNAAETKEATKARCSTTTCSEPGSFSSGAPTGSHPTKQNASNNSSGGIPACGRPGRPWPSCTASTSPRTTKPPSAPCGASLALYAAGELPEFGAVMETVSAWENEILDWHPYRTALQRPPRRNQQPPPDTTANRPRIHQPLQLRSPGTPTNLTTSPTTPPHPKSHTFAKGQKYSCGPAGSYTES